ncbi:esterase-like activity of phytase family protein [Acidovorax sp. NCPPB 3576]|uniref:esterase-like activity of phytase family protein n=1 Tax=Acidovorax sp. NCPPB 3576 TaxID=2940488 RepID=UPI002348F64C|nr:esterase-like activity of phytase family protein [Acidovorax sp. NCPPB 3576]WCM87388.1 esterase-like activity of phytase family protein [Acidovorax sp. NCPPB 3576]
MPDTRIPPPWRRRPWHWWATCLAASAVLLAACTGARQGPEPDPAAPAALRLIGTAAIAPGTEVLGTTFGGISGIDYDPVQDRWLLISDDRSALQPARIYTATLRYTATHLDTPVVTGTAPLRQASGAPYPSQRQAEPGVDVPDAEAVRWLPGGHTFLWTSEGDFARGFGPQWRENRADGAWVRELPLPAAFGPVPDFRRGPRANATLEGLALSPDGRTAWLAMETAWIQDGPRPTPEAPGGPLRITAMDVASGQPWRQIAYVPDAVPHARRIPWGPQLNGVSEVLADGPHHLLVLERSYSAGAGFSARLYRIDTRAGSDTLALDALQIQGTGSNHTAVPKTLVADLDRLGAGPLDNLEGMAWGPPLPGGGRVIVFVSDDNFNPAQATQFIAAEYRGPAARPSVP